MNKQDLLERVCLVKAVPEAVFDLHLEATVRELTVRYGEKYTFEEGQIPLKDTYEDAVYMGILYRVTGDEGYGEQYRRLAQSAFVRIWRRLEIERRERSVSK